MNYNGLTTLSEELTELLMNNGCAVTKPGIDELIQFIARRDQSIVDENIRHQEKLLADLQKTTRGETHER